MAALVTFDAQGRWGEALVCSQRISQALRGQGVAFGHIPVKPGVGENLESALDAYAEALAPLRQQLDVRSADRVTLRPGHPDWERLRSSFLAEHAHAQAEIRFFLGGTGLFYVRVQDGFVGLLCEAGDWVAVPAGAPHCFDGGDAPDFDALRLFGTPDGWAARPTGAPVPPLPSLNAFTGRLLDLSGHEVQ